LRTADGAAARRIRRFSPCAAIPALAAGIADVAASAVRWERARFAAPCARATEPGSGTPRRLPAAAQPLWHLGFEFRPRWDRSVRQSSSARYSAATARTQHAQKLPVADVERQLTDRFEVAESLLESCDAHDRCAIAAGAGRS